MEPPERTSSDERLSCLPDNHSMQCQDQVSSNSPSPLKSQRCGPVYHGMNGLLHLHSLGLAYMSTNISLNSVGFLGTHFLQFTHSNINLKCFTRQHYN